MPDQSLLEDKASRTRHQFFTLDGLRGVAALAIVLRHTPELFGTRLFPHSYLAVDFFFLLSGFVIAHAYQARLDAGWPTADFLHVRFARLYPMYLLGLVFGILSFLLARHLHQSSPNLTVLLVSFLLGLFVLPFWKFIPLPASFAYPLNFPTWSLFGESVANILHAFFLRRFAQRTLLGIAFTSLALLVFFAARLHTIDFGTFRVGVLLVIPRVLFPYTLGMWLHQRWLLNPRNFRIPPVASFLLLLCIFAIPGDGTIALLVDLLSIIVLLPVLLFISNGSITSGRPPVLIGILGQLSYPLYILHVPLERFFSLTCLALTSHRSSDFAPWSGLLFLVLAAASSLLLKRFYDQPFRIRLRRNPTPKSS